MKFEWDQTKAEGNVRKHKVTFDEAHQYSLMKWPFQVQIQTIQ